MTDRTKPLCVLIVEPFDTIRTMITQVVKELGNVKIIQSPNGKDALEKLQYHDVGLIIAGWQLPNITGLEFLKHVRTTARTATTPFLMTSSTIEQSHVVKAIQCGVSEFVVKPFSSKILQSRIQRALTRPVRTYRDDEQNVAEDAADEQIQVLIVDDVADNIKVISDILRKDYKVKAALNGAKALQLCHKEPQPDIILLDIMMPEMDGLEVCRRLKQDPNTQHITVIFLSALEQTEHIVSGLELGAVDYITKPANPAIVKSRVQAHCRSIESNRLMRNQIDTMLENARLRDEFDSMNQTELAKPITQIQQATEQLADNLHQPDHARHCIQAIQQHCTQLQLNLDGLSALTQIERNDYALNPQSHNLAFVIDDVLASFSETLKHQQRHVKADVPEYLEYYGELTLTHTLLSQLLKNAIEASRHSPIIHIGAAQSNEQVVITIKNSDPIPQAVRTQFFDKFVSHGKPHHMGMGTYTAKLLCVVQGGSIDFHTDDELGTEVYIHLPLGK